MIDTAPSWTSPPPPEAIACALDAAEMAAVDDRGLACVAICESGISDGWKAVAAIQMLGGFLRQGVSADELRESVLRTAVHTGASAYEVDSALEAVALADSLQRRDLEAVDELCRVSQSSVIDWAHAACVLVGSIVASLADENPRVVFCRMRASFGGAP